MPICTALYEADKLAHEEAVRNGGVSTPIPLVTGDPGDLPNC